MTARDPGSKSVATKTAKALYAASCDLVNAAKGMRAAGAYYEAGDYEQGKIMADGALGLCKMALRFWILAKLKPSPSVNSEERHAEK